MTGVNPGVALVISAPSGAGKSTLIKRLVEEFPVFSYSVSYTTRPPRAGEQEGREYHFVDNQKFLDLAEQGFFAEWAEVHANYYGTPLDKTKEVLRSGRDLLFDIDVQGARQLKHNLAQGVFIFILPPSRHELRLRLQKRGSEDMEKINTRLQKALQELKCAPEFDFWVMNEDLDEAYDRLRAIYLAEKSRICYNKFLLDNILESWK